MATQILRPIFIQPSRLNEYLDESINLVNFYGEPISITFRDIDKWLTFSYVSLMSYGVAIGLIFPVLLLILHFTIKDSSKFSRPVFLLNTFTLVSVLSHAVFNIIV